MWSSLCAPLLWACARWISAMATCCTIMIKKPIWQSFTNEINTRCVPNYWSLTIVSLIKRINLSSLTWWLFLFFLSFLFITSFQARSQPVLFPQTAFIQWRFRENVVSIIWNLLKNFFKKILFLKIEMHWK